MSADRVQAALAAALQSREFQSAPQLRAFLGFIVRATLDHEQEKLKGYTIAVEALGRPEDFNPVTDPIVRVEAARLRRRLEKYYAGSGADDPVRIIVPKGSYAPEFQLAFCPGPHDRAVGGLLELQEVGREFEPASARAPDELDAEETTQAIGTADKPARIVAGPRHDNAASAPVIEPPTQTGPADWSQFTGRLAGHSVPLPVTLLIGGACFLAGYLFG